MNSNHKKFHAHLTVVLDPTTDPSKVTPVLIERHMRTMLDMGGGHNAPDPFTIVGLSVTEASSPPTGMEDAEAFEPRAGERGRLHVTEPDSDAYYGCLWERTDGDRAPPRTIADLLATAREAKLEVDDIEEAWLQGEWSPQSTVLIDRIIARALEQGIDVYDSDTRTWFYTVPTECEECPTGACREDADAHLAKATGGGARTGASPSKPRAEGAPGGVEDE